MRTKSLFVALGLVLVLALVVSACAPPATPVSEAPAAEQPAAEQPAAEQPVAEAEPVTITWAFWGSPEEAASHQTVADAFMVEHPEIKIEVWNQPWEDYFTKIQALWASGDSATIPDVAFLWPTPKYAAEGVLENLDSYIKDAGYDLGDYWPGLLESASYQGSVYGFPRDIEVNVLYYNKDLFDAAGVAYPDENWTWDDLQAAAEKLTIKDDSGNTTQYALAMEGGKYAKWVNQNGGGILDDYVNPSKCMMDDPKSVEAITFFADLMNNGYAMRDADLSQAGGDAAVFSSDQAAMIIQNTSRVSAFNAAGKNYDVAVVPIPAGGQRWNGAGGAAWVMSSGSDNKDAAWTFLQWLQSDGGGESLYTDRGEIFPALQSVAESPAFMTDQPPANKQGIIDEAAASGVGGFGYFPEWDELNSSVISPYLESIWAGEANPAEVLPEMCQQANQFLADNGYPK
ncbi:MAG: sugar ABC transporter substrate-binding protein [Caldilineae bacterium]|nr:sugar ABC transporter substrate-binding protein [Anaerolineae bacterium]MCB0252322.1 sugar ABC transporter substrate-binding protein [Anaerolineae bacterium]MCB9153852.1 sugar ABC transporter substrate-binding protein [Caldilineae bacterium]